MNSPFRSPTLPFGTQAAEGLTRRRWSVAEIKQMTGKEKLMPVFSSALSVVLAELEPV